MRHPRIKISLVINKNMKNGYKKFKEDVKVEVAECYLNDEVNQRNNTSLVATVFSAPTDDEQLVGIQYEGGAIDYVPQDILTLLVEIKD